MRWRNGWRPNFVCDRRGQRLCAEAVRPAITSTLHLSATAAADEFKRRGIATVSGKRWQATQVIRARRRLGLTATTPA